MPSCCAISFSAALISSACARDSSVFGPMMKTIGRSLPIVMLPIAMCRGFMGPPVRRPGEGRDPLIRREIYPIMAARANQLGDKESRGAVGPGLRRDDGRKAPLLAARLNQPRLVERGFYK